MSLLFAQVLFDGKKNIKTVTVTTSFLNDMVTQIAKDKVKIETIIPAEKDPWRIAMSVWGE